MFAYNPTPDRSGEILGASTAQAAAIRAQGTAQFSQALSDSVNTAVSMYTKSQQKAQDNKITSDHLDALAGEYAKTNRIGTNTPYLSAKEWEQFSTLPLGKRSGIIAGIQAREANDMRQWMYQTQYNRNYQAAAAKSAASQPAPNQIPAGVVPQDIYDQVQ